MPSLLQLHFQYKRTPFWLHGGAKRGHRLREPPIVDHPARWVTHAALAEWTKVVLESACNREAFDVFEMIHLERLV